MQGRTIAALQYRFRLGSYQSDTVVAQPSHRAGVARVPTGYERISIGETSVSWFEVVKLYHDSDPLTPHVDNFPLPHLAFS